jgi:hypothetical protein
VHLHAEGSRPGAFDGEGARRVEADGTPVWLAAYHFVHQVAQPLAELSQLWAWLVKLLMDRDSGLSRFDGDEPPHRVMCTWAAITLLATDNPAAAWTAAYRALEPQRRRAQFWRYDDIDIVRPSLVLIRVGLDAAALSAKRQRFADARALFDEVELAARALWLTSANDHSNQRRQHYASVFAYVASVFGSDWAQRAASLWPFVASGRWIVCTAALFLTNNGVPLAEVQTSARNAGIDLAHTLCTRRDWAREMAEHFDFPPALAKFLDALQATERWRG